MVNIVENWTNIKGKVEAILPHKSNASYSMISITVSTQKNVKQFASLYEALPGRQLECMVLTAALEKAKIIKGSFISCHISKKPPLNFINPESVKMAKP
jgi:hypothetical protein